MLVAAYEWLLVFRELHMRTRKIRPADVNAARASRESARSFQEADCQNRTNDQFGFTVRIIVDENNKPIDGELWWTPNCSARIDPQARIHQPHYPAITRQNHAQI